MENLVFLEPRNIFDKMIIGVCTAPRAIAYDKDKLISHWQKEFQKESDISEENAYIMAVEWFEFNVEGAYMGKHTPIYISKVEVEDYL